MTPRTRGGTQPCDREAAQERLRRARAFMDQADLADPSSSDEERAAAGSSAVLAGIAASDAACCAALRRRSRTQDHADAANLLAEIEPGGADAAQDFRRLIVLKDEAQYGFGTVSGPKLTSAKRRAQSLIEFAEHVLTR